MKAKMVQQKSLDDLSEKIRTLEESTVDKASLDEKVDEMMKMLNEDKGNAEALVDLKETIMKRIDTM